MTSGYIQLAQNKLSELRVRDSGLSLFGAAAHRYALNPVAAPETIATFEKRNQCVLPETYRDFLIHLGNGGAGPSYGVFPLGMMDHLHDLSPWSEDWVKPSEPFPFTEAYNNDSALRQGAPGESAFPSTSAYEAAYDEWWDEHGEQLSMEYWEEHELRGAIPIVHHGCAQRTWLVVAQGVEYGYLWDDLTPDEGGVRPVQSSSHHRYTFGEWYMAWLDKALRCLE